MLHNNRAVLLLALLCFSLHSYAGTPVFKVRGLNVAFSPFTVVAEPGEEIEIGQRGSIVVHRVTASLQPGHYLHRASFPGGVTANFNVFVTVPASEVIDGMLNGYRIGPSPPENDSHPQNYSAPAGFIEVSEELLDTPLSPHFTLRQLLCKQESSFPKYIALQESLLVLLEGLLGEVRSRGYPVATFGVISGYRTPWYNKNIGNVANSRHVYGDAMDFYVDVDGDGNMDDIDRDGDRDLKDVQLLVEIVREYMTRPENAMLVGGVGRYGKTSRHGGFVHVDTRGYPARW